MRVATAARSERRQGVDEILEQMFSDIGDEAMTKAESVKCSLADFAKGLRIIEDLFHNRRKGVEEEELS